MPALPADLLAPVRSELPGVTLAARIPLGFGAAATSVGIKASGGPDVGILTGTGDFIITAGVFTTNRVAAAPVRLSRRHLAETDGRVFGLISTSGCANAATGAAGDADQEALARDFAQAIQSRPEETLAISTGLIGTRLPVDRIRAALPELVRRSSVSTDEALLELARQICTTDTRAKVASADVDLGAAGAHPVRVSGIAKGVGMLHPRMATMLALILTDAKVQESSELREILHPVVARTWNQLTVDGDTSTNDTVFLMASGGAAAPPVEPGSEAAERLAGAVEAVARSLARQQAADGEGAQTLITCQVTGARDDVEARAVARAVVASSLVKAAVHGRDPNWGRIAAAAGNAHLPDRDVLEGAGLRSDEAAERAGAPVEIEPARLSIAICGTPVYAGEPLEFQPASVSAAMSAREVLIRVDLGAGGGLGEAFGCDLTERYVVENSAYST